MAIRLVTGGSTGKSIHLGPGEFAKGYDTVRNGWAQPIRCETGEAIVQVRAGDAYDFARWAAGPVEELIDWLRAKKHVALAERLAAVVLVEPTPAARLANALGKSAHEVAEAALLAGVSLSLV